MCVLVEVRDDIRCLTHPLSHFWDGVFHWTWNWPGCLGWKDRRLQNPCLRPLSTGVMHTGFYMRIEDLNLGPLAYPASTLPIKPRPQSPCYLYSLTGTWLLKCRGCFGTCVLCVLFKSGWLYLLKHLPEERSLNFSILFSAMFIYLLVCILAKKKKIGESKNEMVRNTQNRSGEVRAWHTRAEFQVRRALCPLKRSGVHQAPIHKDEQVYVRVLQNH